MSTRSRLYMLRETLAGIPEQRLPTGLSLRGYTPGDEQHWVRIHEAAAPEVSNWAELFRTKLNTNAEDLARRQLYLLDSQGLPIATVTAWHDANLDGRPAGRIHFVAVTPAWQGRGLSKVLVAVGCRRLQDLGDSRAYLVTDSKRIRAINLYLSFDFRPWASCAEDVGVWSALADELRPEHREAVLHLHPSKNAS